MHHLSNKLLMAKACDLLAFLLLHAVESPRHALCSAALVMLASSQQQISQQAIRIQHNVAAAAPTVMHHRSIKAAQSVVKLVDRLAFPSILLFVCGNVAANDFYDVAGGAVAHQLQPQAQYPAQPAAGLQSHALHPASHAMVAAPSAQHHSSYQYPQAYAHPQMGSSGTHAGQMGAMDSVQDTALLQVQAALTDPSKASLNMPAQQGSRPQAEASQGVGAAGAIASAGAGLLGVAPAAVSSGQQHTSGVLSAAGGSASGEGTPAGR
jgi:hypothetical protein